MFVCSRILDLLEYLEFVKKCGYPDIGIVYHDLFVDTQLVDKPLNEMFLLELKTWGAPF